LAIGPGLAALVFVVWPELRGGTPSSGCAIWRAWYDLPLPWQLGIGLVVGFALSIIAGGDSGAAAG
jgi:hypothetical protein